MEIPFRLDIVNGKPWVGLLETGAEIFAHSCLDAEVQRMVKQGHARQIVPLDDMAASALELQGVIFHMTACGSKLVTNWLTANGFRVVSESTVIAHLDNVVDSSSQRRLLLAKIVGLYANSGLRSTVPTLLKLSARSLNLLEDIRALNPQVPVVFLARNPLEVIASNLDNPRGWVRAKESTPRFAARFLELPESHLADMSLEEYMARTLARMCVLALPFLGRRTLVLDYQNLDSCSLNLLSNLLGRGHSHKKRLSASNCLSYYDGVSSGDPFHCANLAKLSRVRPSFVEACDRWAIPAYRCLLETAGQN